MAKPTPGPWLSRVDTVETADGRVVCDVRHAGTHVTGANARLLAAAPDLLAACKAMLRGIDGRGEERCWCLPAAVCEACQMRAAVAKAKGEEA